MVVSFNTEVVNGLCSDDQLELLDAVDQLRLHGIDHYISLPQIIVCGDQSSGKSSVLEAISGVPFPVKSNLCTRFPTELILRRSQRADVKVSIIPHSIAAQKRPRNKELSAFHEKLDGFDGLAALIDSAKVAMGISMQGKGFSKDLLRIEISGPHHPHLTIVDLPGLIHSETKQQSAWDVELVKDVVQTYMKKRRSIILAVVSAKNDFANQIVLTLARSADPKGKRTMGVITKPDMLVESSDSEAMYVSLAENKEVEFNLGWHVLRNLDSEKVDGSSLLRRRNKEEQDFFSNGVWSRLPSSMLGVEALRTKLSEVLLKQVATELPNLITEIDGKMRRCSDLLGKLGEPRATADEQKLHLINISEKYQPLIYAAIQGTYNTNPFFEKADTDIGYDQRLRAVIQNLNRDFAAEMTQFGHARNIVSPKDKSTHRNAVTRDDFIKETQEMMRRTRGRELPGRFDSPIITDLFLEQSKPWRKIVLSHIDSCWVATKQCLKLVITSIAEEPVGSRLLRNVIDPALSGLRDIITCKAIELTDSQVLCHPLTNNEQYLDAVHRIHNERRREFCTGIVEKFFGISVAASNSYLSRQSYDFNSLVNQLSQRQEPDDERFAASEAVDCMEAYYSVALKRIVDDISIEVIERKLMTALPAILSPTVVFNMSYGAVATIAGESFESRTRRTRLANQIEILTKGSETCKRFADVRLDVEDINEEVDEEADEMDIDDPPVPLDELEPADLDQLEIPDSEEERLKRFVNPESEEDRQKKTKKNRKKKMRNASADLGL
ncbi:putative dynamin family GTPase [Xylaria flabelliformis]|nr:putative dynamin family GTPase [Xylaria flabelliformis]